MKKILTALILAIFFSTGCTHSPVPDAKNFRANEQKLFQAAHHWEVLAEQQAAKIIAVAHKNDIYLSHDVHVSPFEKAFYDLLLSKMVSNGGNVVAKSSPDTIDFSYKVHIITHNKQQHPATLDPFDIVDLIFLKRQAPEQRFEVLITTVGTKHDRILMSDSQLYYIFSDNVGNYKTSGIYRVFPITNK